MTELVIMQGLPRSGKSTSLLRYHVDNYEIIELDKLRLELTGKEYDEDNEPAVWDYARVIAKSYLSEGKSVVIDESNPTILCIEFWLKLRGMVAIDNVKIVRLTTDFNTCMTRTNNPALRSAIIRKSNCMMSLNDITKFCNDNNYELEVK